MGDGETCSEMSQVTVDSDEMLQVRSSSILDYAEFEGRRTEWTNEKHCLYIKSMEASFVKELHCSMGFLGARGNVLEEGMEKDLFQQRKSFRDGYWENIGENGYGRVLEATSRTRALMTNPWIRQFRRADKHHVKAAVFHDIDHSAEQEIEFELKANLVLDINSTRQSKTTLSQQDSAGAYPEMSDQNFVGEDESMKSRSARCAKRKKMEANHKAYNDQVVPKDQNTTSDCKRMALNHRS